MALNYSALTALTKKKYLPKLRDNFFNSHPLLVLFKDKIYQPWDGEPVEPLIYGDIGYVGSYRTYDTIQYDTGIPITAATFDIRNLVAPIIIDLDSERRNSTPQKVISLLEAKMQVVEKTLQAEFSRQMWGDGTGNDGKDLIGLPALISDSGTIGGIDRATYTWWRSKVFANGGVPRALTTDLLMVAYMSCSDGNDAPDLHIVDQKTWLVYYKLLEGKLQIQGELSKRLLNYGYEVLEFKGKPVVWDRDVPEGTWWMINSDYLKLRYHKDANFSQQPWRRADNMLAKKSEILWSGGFTISNARRFAVIKDIDVSAWSGLQ